MKLRRLGNYQVQIDGATLCFKRTAETAAIAVSLAFQFQDGLRPERIVGLMQSLGQWLIEWEGVEDETGPIPVTPANYEALLQERPELWVEIIEQIVGATQAAIAKEAASQPEGADPTAKPTDCSEPSPPLATAP